MTEIRESPYVAHVFICTNDREGERESCADNNSILIKSRLKEYVNVNGWKGRIRVSTSGCMGLCLQGPNVMIYPQKIWFKGVSPEDLKDIESAITRIVSEN